MGLIKAIVGGVAKVITDYVGYFSKRILPSAIMTFVVLMVLIIIGGAINNGGF